MREILGTVHLKTDNIFHRESIDLGFPSKPPYDIQYTALCGTPGGTLAIYSFFIILSPLSFYSLYFCSHSAAPDGFMS
ncbi:hypothetical protein XENTR_v10000320 [Xenopus tropicalis]|nr:hypothetical protein XENTR_v10000320 [Xenopus tropicalis]